MKRIIKIGMDVHSTNFTLCALECLFEEDDRILMELQVSPDYKLILAFIERLKQKYHLDTDTDIVCGYEAGCLGFSLYNQLTRANVKCVILAPSTMSAPKGKRIKTDTRDARMIAQCLANKNSYHAVHIPTKEDHAVKEYIRMRDDHKEALKKIKQQINAFCLLHGFHYDRSKWTIAHRRWLRRLDFDDTLLQEVLDEYLVTYDQLTDKIQRLDERIEELSRQSQYDEKVGNLKCFCGIKTTTALSVVVETGDFDRFKGARSYAAFLGLVPGESSSADSINRTGITKTGNAHLRRLLIEAAQSICRGEIAHKSKELKARQAGHSAEVIAYADKAAQRLRRKYYRYIRHGKKHNVAIAAVARELACFIWGMMTDHIYQRATA